MLKVELVDAAGTQHGVGVYSDAAGFMAGERLTLFVHDWEEYHRKHNDPTWPVNDSRIFYTSGSLEMAVPPGPCRLVAAKGIEFRRHDETLDIKAGETICAASC